MTAGKSLILSAAVVASISVARADEPIRFNRDIRPILSENCFACHGHDSGHRKAGLRLDRQEGLFGAREKGPPVVPGKPNESQLYKHVVTTDVDEVMPPPKSKKTITPAQKETLKRWIEQGAAWEPHWSMVAPSRPSLPNVKDGSWVRNPIDAFILARLEKEGLTPAPDADRRSLIRRVSFDLIGLPPTPAEVQAFVEDKSADAYEKVVDRLLASPHYGEHRARYWLDAARYGDTHGIHNDNYVELWTYRDWVINAFNRNLPFDRFTVEQIAGDLLPGRTLEQWIATGFHRCNPTTSEGGSIDAEVEAMYAKERVETTCTVWLGLTAQCTSCHDHKFDPITMKDFYSFSAFFRNTPQRAMDGNIFDTPPNLPVPSEKDRPRWEGLVKEREALVAQKKTLKDKAAKPFDDWFKSAEARKLTEPLDTAGQHLTLGLSMTDPSWVGVTLDSKDDLIEIPNGLTWAEGRLKDEKALEFGAKADLSFPNGGDFEADQPFSVGGWIYVPKQDGQYTIISKRDPNAKNPAGWTMELSDRVLTFTLIGDKGKDDRLQIRLSNSQRLLGGKWAHVFATYDGSRSIDGLSLYVNEKPIVFEHTGDLTLKGSIRNKAPLRVGFDGKKDFHGGAIEDLRIYRRELDNEEVEVVSHWPVIRKALRSEDSKQLASQRANMLELYLNRFDTPYQQTMMSLEKNEDGQRAIRRTSAIALVMVEKNPTTRPSANILHRGQYDQPRDEVWADTPAVLPPMHKDWPKNRLGLAWWLIDKENPLTPRVTINRIWQEIFGTGIIKSTEDFGAMGELPSHPELLEWLAVEFREPSVHGATPWDIKRMIRLMVTSSTYRQSSAATPEKLQRDSENRLLSHAPRFRMDGEVLRDFALASSGLLVPQIGGPSVKPYQPPGVWEAVAMFSSNTRFYKQDSGDKLYRRSLYTFIKRSAPPASMDIFNAPGRLNCTVRRERTDTPLQALVTMNDPQWVEASRHLAERALKEAGGSFDQRLDYITMHAVSRPFDPQERKICRATLEDFLKTYRADTNAADQLIHTGDSKPFADVPPVDLAAWTMVASEVMNTDEALNK